MSDWFGNWFGQWFGRSAGESLPSGAATFSVGATGALSAIGQLSGTAGLTLGTTGDLTGSASTGAAVLSLGATGALTAVGALTGDANFALATTGTLSDSFAPASVDRYYSATSSGDPIDDDELMELAAMLVASGALDQPRRSHHGLA